MIRLPDWNTARFVNSLDELATIDDAMTLAQVHLHFQRASAFHRSRFARAKAAASFIHCRERPGVPVQNWS